MTFSKIEEVTRRLELHRMSNESLIAVYVMCDCLGHEDLEMIFDEIDRRREDKTNKYIQEFFAISNTNSSG